MKITIITRHNATVDIIKHLIINGTIKIPALKIDFGVIPHLTDDTPLGDIIIGVLPVPMIKQILDQGKDFYLFTLNNIPPDLRGKDLTQDDIDKIGYSIYKINSIDLDKII